MRIFSFVASPMLAVAVIACGVEKPSDLKKFKDVKKAVLRQDGLYNVICFDGAVETGITLEQLENDEVCHESSDDDLRAEFIRECRRTPSNLQTATFSALKGIAGRTDCDATYDELSRRDTLIIFAYPSKNPDALTSVEPLKYFPQLRRLGVFAQKIKDLRPLSGLTRLENLALSYNEITDVSPLANLRNLEHLDLSHNRIRDFSPVENLPRLKELVREGNP